MSLDATRWAWKQNLDSKRKIVLLSLADRADHIKPESWGGETSLDNLQTLCRSCNSKKNNRYEG